MAMIRSVKIKAFNRDKEKARGDSVEFVITAGNKIVFASGPLGGDLVYRKYTEGWANNGDFMLLKDVLDTSSSKNKLKVSKTGAGEWTAQFLVWGQGQDGYEYELLPRTQQVSVGVVEFSFPTFTE